VSKFQIKQVTSNKDQKSFYEIIFIVLTTAFTSILVLKYGDVFFELEIAAKTRLLEDPELVFIFAPIFFWLSAYICRKFARSSSGNTSNHIDASLLRLKKNPESLGKLSSKLNVKSVIVNIISSLLATFGGGALGREAPSVYMSASIFAVVAQKLKKALPKINFESWIFAGSVVGFAIAFHAPIAGFIYVVEKLFLAKTKNFLNDIFWTVIVLFVVIFVLHKAEPIFFVHNLQFWFGSEVMIMAMLAIFCGVLALSFKHISILLYGKIDNIRSNFWHAVPILAGVIVASVSFYGGVYSFSGGIQTARDALSGDGIVLSYNEVIARVINTGVTFISGCAGGLVAPAIGIGAGIGSIFSSLLTTIDPRIFILSGMAAFLSPILGMPFTAAMVILETSSQPILAFPFLFFAAAMSFFAGKIMNKTYLQVIRYKGIITSKPKN
jgi:H+/Cl- antiporter ClcA